MKNKIIKKICVTALIILACLLIYLVGYKNGFKTAEYKYYYDGMKVDYSFHKIKYNYQKMLELNEIVEYKINDTNYVSKLKIYNNKFIRLSPDTLYFREDFPDIYYVIKGNEIINYIKR